ncbi:MAG: PQQ-dependent dehydrogenase, methanol/ethanol family [Halieaceae bacterium]|jgi:quinohemoprotein ethanol dehydrogenase|nr:PQQ-dependent dehydrogenase, methanol/ethanol family [Halieaceae bacterium]
MKNLWVLAFALIVSACSEKEAAAPVELPETAAPQDQDWALHGNDWGEQRYASLDQVNRNSVDKLGLTWFFDMYTRRGIEATPLVVDGVMYVTGSWSMVYALDARNGKLLWFHDPKVERAFMAKGCCGVVNRGVAYYEGKIYVGTYDGRLVALKASSGELIWDVQTTDRDQSYTISGAPRIAGDKVIIGNGGAELGVRGYVSAYSADSGEMVWRFYTVPGNPDDGFENPLMEKIAKTWNGEWWKWGGGGTVWDSMVYDPELDLLYIGVGNGSPWNQALRSPGGGDNLFLASIVALRPDTGEYVWHYQTGPGETWDHTATQHIMLSTLNINGEPRKVLMQAPKNGFFYVLDRETGELLSANNYTPVSWASSIDMETGRPVETAGARNFDEGNPTLPGNGGGHNWPPMSFNPQTGLVYIPVMSFPSTFHTPVDDIDTLPNQGFWNLGFNTRAMAPPSLPQDQLDQIMDQTFTGQLVAWDPVKQEARWSYDHTRISFSGTLSTSGMLVFQGDMHGNFAAFDAESGEKLWSKAAQTSVMAPPITYSIEGEQYIAVAVGFGGGGAAEGGALTSGWKMPNKSRVLVYKLGGTTTLPPLPENKAVMPKPQPVTRDATVIAQGQKHYQRHCRYCHGDGLRTGNLTPDLRWASDATHDQWQDIVIGGSRATLGMVSFSDYLSPDDAEAIRQYVLSEAGILYGELSAGADAAAMEVDTR